MTATAMPDLPQKVYLRRKEVVAAVGGWRQLKALASAGHLRPVHLPGYSRAHYVRAEVQAVLVTMLGR
jgi:hypothetical protein